jgi:hypothetical protein
MTKIQNLKRFQNPMNRIDSALYEKLHSACLRLEPFGCEPLWRELRVEPLMPKVAYVEDL